MTEATPYNLAKRIEDARQDLARLTDPNRPAISAMAAGVVIERVERELAAVSASLKSVVVSSQWPAVGGGK